jgi:hypothetical protein
MLGSLMMLASGVGQFAQFGQVVGHALFRRQEIGKGARMRPAREMSRVSTA